MLHHRVGGGSYATSCQSGKTHVLSIRKEGVPIGTLTLERDGRAREEGDVCSSDGTTWKESQFRGDHNYSPNPDAQEAWKRFKDMAREGKFELTSSHGRIKGWWAGLVNNSELVLGYEVDTARFIAPKILDHYTKRIAIVREKRGEVTPLLSEASRAYILKRLTQIPPRTIISNPSFHSTANDLPSIFFTGS